MPYKFRKRVFPLCSFCIEEPDSSFSFLYKNKLSLDAATTFFAKCNKNPSNYTTEHHLWID